jgi:hypothetical protein
MSGWVEKRFLPPDTEEHCAVCGRSVRYLIGTVSQPEGYVHSDTPIGRYFQLPSPHAARVEGL